LLQVQASLLHGGANTIQYKMMADEPTTTSFPSGAAGSGKRVASALEAGDGVAASSQPQGPVARWKQWVLPSFADLIFLVLASFILLTPAIGVLLADADTGWHIRNGELILATHQVPHTDPFSYTRGGAPWYAWEWFYDAVIAAIHHVAGLNGVVLFTAVIIALTFSLLFRFVLRRSGNFVVAVGLTLLAAGAAQVHMLARPHVLSWLFTLLWLEALYRFAEGRSTVLLWLPPLMLLWVNVHGGFLLGIVLLAMFLCGELWNVCRAPDKEGRRRLTRLAAVLVLCLGVTLLTPYGYELHVHVYEYLSNGYLMNSIDEFMSPNFHAHGYGYFEALILLSFLAAVWGRRALTATDLLLLLFAIHIGLYSSRNIPLAGIFIALATAPVWAEVLSASRKSRPAPARTGALLDSLRGISDEMGGMESRFRGHLLVVTALVLIAAVAVNGGRLFSRQVMDAHFNEHKFPVRAAEFIASQNIRNGVFNPDSWSGYLIYRLYPQTRFYFDDRHDFFGEAFVRDYVKIRNADSQWPELLRKYQVRWVLIPARWSLTAVLKESRDWHLEYDDGLAVVFSRISR